MCEASTKTDVDHYRKILYKLLTCNDNPEDQVLCPEEFKPKNVKNLKGTLSCLENNNEKSQHNKKRTHAQLSAATKRGDQDVRNEYLGMILELSTICTSSPILPQLPNLHIIAINKLFYHLTL